MPSFGGPGFSGPGFTPIAEEAAPPGQVEIPLNPASATSSSTLALRSRIRVLLAPAHSESATAVLPPVIAGAGGQVHPPTRLDVIVREDSHMLVEVPDRTLLFVVADRTGLLVTRNSTHLELTNYG